MLYLFFHNQAIFKKLGSAFCQKKINNLHFFFPTLERRFVSVTDQRMHRGFWSNYSWYLFALFQSLVIFLVILQLSSHEISARAHGRARSSALRGLCSSRERKNPLAKSWVTVQCLPMFSCSSWPLILASAVLIDLFERCIWSASQKTGWIFSLVHLGLFTALAWIGDGGLQNKLGSEK